MVEYPCAWIYFLCYFEFDICTRPPVNFCYRSGMDFGSMGYSVEMIRVCLGVEDS